MKRYYCSQCKIYALAINYKNETPICMCGKKMWEREE